MEYVWIVTGFYGQTAFVLDVFKSSESAKREIAKGNWTTQGYAAFQVDKRELKE